MMKFISSHYNIFLVSFKWFNVHILHIIGDLERLSRFWMSGMCKPNIQEKHASEPLSIAQFLSAFLLLGIGTVLSLVFIILEHLYIKYLQRYVDKKNTDYGGCFSLFSQVILLHINWRCEHINVNDSNFTHCLIELHVFWNLEHRKKL